MEKKKVSLEARKALDEFKVEMAEELGSHVPHQNVYDLRANLTRSDDVTEQLIPVKETSRSNPNNSFSDFLGKYF